MTAAKTYMIKECFYSPQGEGYRVGTMNVFLRFTGCNLQCTVEKEGFNCDTDFQGGMRLTEQQVVELVQTVDVGRCFNVIFTGGEPTLQLDTSLMDALRLKGYRLHLETNGTRSLEKLRGAMWISCSPKPGSPPQIAWADEVRCVVKPGLAPDVQGVRAQHYFVSPAFDAPPEWQIRGWTATPGDMNKAAIEWAVKWCEQNPKWRISLQMHKLLGVR